ncbi:Caffeyl-CoA reductase-Etf complex subunit CarE [Neomoorella glycerini]|uniref:Ferredoxin n=1 Tax=Neomoorella glycerini TaxID=55779 RepID=A0A6I5ZV61_9FIRM|nr:4Fe-4S binding protein [Moorella glycerini]QGP93870.1 Caffeyl-CoA reductase-Etf complex subunit CarE [Moorella glycerini]
MAARVDEEKCTGCGSCVEVCPVEAITVEEVAVINADECLECSACVEECPNEAISLD